MPNKEFHEIIPIDAEEELSKRILPVDGDLMPVLPLRNKVLFPHIMLPISVARPASLQVVKLAYERKIPIAVSCQKESEREIPGKDDLYSIGVYAYVLKIIDLPDESVMAILDGQERIEITSITQELPYLAGNISIKNEIMALNSKEFLTTVSQVKDLAVEIFKLNNVPTEITQAMRGISNAYAFINYICTNYSFDIEDKQKVLEVDEYSKRADMLLAMLHKEKQVSELKANINNRTREEMSKQQREYFLHQQMQTIQKELGDTSAQEIEQMRKDAKTKKWNKTTADFFEKELKKLEQMSHSPEYPTQFNFLQLMLDLPWNEYSKDNYDIHRAQKILNNDHYGIDSVKERILEFLSVLKMKGNMKSPILCLYGPPGVGKTSLGKSIARSLGRKYTRISLGGLHDEAEIRGHRRTYIGAMPGRIIQNIQKAKTSNPVFVLDEIDKISNDYHGDPSSALLEVLDPEQNATFHDNYLDVDYDLSKVLFIATANSLNSIPRPLLDRMELIEMTGYLIEEKIEIAKRHLIPKVFEEHGIKTGQLKFSKDTLTTIIDGYTRESGVRELERQIGRVVRKVVKHIALNEPYNIKLTNEDILQYLGKPRYSRDMYENNDYVGVATGLAWTQVGGEILFIETSLSASKQPKLTMTGNLGDVMKESATIALEYVHSHAADFDINPEDFDKYSVHIHVPEGAIPKDGPSAGITMTTAIASAFTHKKIRERLAMTGEMTLRGKVLPVGGIKEKILAAKRAGITDIILCKDNQKDIDEINPEYVNGVTFHYVNDIHQVIDFALI